MICIVSHKSTSGGKGRWGCINKNYLKSIFSCSTSSGLQSDCHFFCVWGGRGRGPVHLHHHHIIIRAAFVCLLVCSPTPPRSSAGSLPNLVGVFRWTSELPLRGSFFKRSKGHFFGADNTRLRPHRCKRLMASFAQQKAHGV